MKQSFLDQWKQRLWEFERESFFVLKDIPHQLTEETIVAYLKEHKRLHQLGSNPIVWIVVLWLPVLGLTGGLVYLWWLLTILIGPFLFTYAYVFVLLFIMSIFAVIYVLNEDAISVARHGLFCIGWVIACFFHLPFLPLLKIRQIQLQYSMRYWKSTSIVWRSEMPTLRERHVCKRSRQRYLH